MNNNKDAKRHHGATTNNQSISHTDSQDDVFHSTSGSPLQQDEFPSSPSKAIVAFDKPPAKAQLSTVAYNRSAREDSVTGVRKVGPGGVEEGNGGAGRERRSSVGTLGLRRSKREVMVDRSALVFRVLELILSVIAFSVMATDKTQGWSGDSFDRYREYRYVVGVNAIAFAYAAFQAIDMTYLLINGNHIISYSLRPHFDFLIDQILAYLLISASSSAATRVDDWVSNWGKDEFTQMATASIGISFLAFLAFALSSLISGYNLCTQSSL
ncbi:CASP-like protein 4A3 isoform X2 [Lactuca sativa]|uniref:CASP-like protein 4A3 isoform X2 n=1 Tax=Lactuca sativa TaxID=4236 RepID=UPI000CD847B5|nr:CASP-like protein 4A3 isoform X2 [Lactuca sativa]